LSIRVYALSTELNVPSKKLLELCKLEGISVRSHASTLTESEAERLRAGLARLAEARADQQKAAEEPEPPQPTAPGPLAPHADATKLAFAPKLGARRRRPPQRGVKVKGAADQEAEEAEAAEAEVPAQSPAAPPPAAAVAEQMPEAEARQDATPTAEAGEEEAPPEEKKGVSIDEFIVEVPKALGRIEGIVPKRVPPRGGAGKKAKEKDRPKEPEPAHPQALGLTPKQMAEASRRARELAKRTVEQASRQTPSQRGILADTNRPQSGRSAMAGRRRGKHEAVFDHDAPEAEAETEQAEGKGEGETKKPARSGKGGQRGRRRDAVELDSDIGVLGIGHMRLERGEEVRRPFGERRRRRRPTRSTKRADEPVARGTVDIEEPVTVKSFCSTLGVQSGVVISRLMRRGMMVTVNQVLDTPLAEELALEFGVELKVKVEADVEERIKTEIEEADARRGESQPVSRAPVVVFLGHVDHGNTSLMDRIRSTRVVDGESGGITQHIGAYRVQIKDRAVTFLDTPGHEAFTAMRARGAQITDVAVLVVAADDGVMPQTEEAINHARAAGVPIVVALNKIDLPGINVQRVYGQLAEHDLVPEEWGGKTIVVQTSAVSGQGVDDLVESLALEAELLELAADPGVDARGTVIEADMREGLGPVMTLLVRHGTLRIGDIVLAGTAFGRVRAMEDDQGRPVEDAGPSVPVSVSGLSSVPSAGDRFYVFGDIQEARAYADERERKDRERSLATRPHVTLEQLFEQMEARKVQQLNVILKADVQGSVQVLTQSLGELKHPEVEVAVLHAAVGGINESDVLLADASDAVIIGFHVIADERARSLAESRGVDIRLYSVIYQVTDDLKKALEGMLEPETREEVTGHLVIRQTFKVSRLGTVAGCYVTDGAVQRTSRIRVSRQGIVMYEGAIDSLKRFKDDIREVQSGLECGVKIKGFDDIKVDDVLEAIEVVKVKRTL